MHRAGAAAHRSCVAPVARWCCWVLSSAVSLHYHCFARAAVMTLEHRAVCSLPQLKSSVEPFSLQDDGQRRHPQKSRSGDLRSTSSVHHTPSLDLHAGAGRCFHELHLAAAFLSPECGKKVFKRHLRRRTVGDLPFRNAINKKTPSPVALCLAGGSLNTVPQTPAWPQTQSWSQQHSGSPLQSTASAELPPPSPAGGAEAPSIVALDYASVLRLLVIWVVKLTQKLRCRNSKCQCCGCWCIWQGKRSRTVPTRQPPGRDTPQS